MIAFWGKKVTAISLVSFPGLSLTGWNIPLLQLVGEQARETGVNIFDFFTLKP
jgi:hypothetical protein